jgi:hypothetical protein
MKFGGKQPNQPPGIAMGKTFRAQGLAFSAASSPVFSCAPRSKQERRLRLNE